MTHPASPLDRRDTTAAVRPPVALLRRLGAVLILALTLALALSIVGGPGTPAAEAAGRKPLFVSTANIGSTSDPNIDTILGNVKPHVMVVSEAYFARDRLRALGRSYGYQEVHYTEADGHEARDVAMMVRKDVTITSRSLMKMNERWSYNGKRREPRRYPVLVVKYANRSTAVIGVHFPPGGPTGGNRAAWAESKRRIQAYAARHTYRVLAAGDFNAGAEAMRNHFPGFDVAKGAKVDHAISKKGRGLRFDAVVSHVIRNKNSHGWLTFKTSIA